MTPATQESEPQVKRDAFGNRKAEQVRPPSSGPQQESTPPLRRIDRARFELDGAEESRGFLFPLLAVLLLLVGAGVLARTVQAPADPHLAKAKRWLEDYEFAKLPQERNYRHPVYAQVLAELAQVRPGSESAAEADALSARIRSATGGFEHDRQVAETTTVARREARQRRNRRFELNQRAYSDVEKGAVLRHVCDESPRPAP